MKEKPNIFKPDVGDVSNNEEVYYSFLNNKKEKKLEGISPRDFLKKIEEDGSYIFSKKVIIETKTKKYDTKIAGKVGNNIITTESKVIPIDSIINIYKK